MNHKDLDLRGKEGKNIAHSFYVHLHLSDTI